MRWLTGPRRARADGSRAANAGGRSEAAGDLLARIGDQDPLGDDTTAVRAGRDHAADAELVPGDDHGASPPACGGRPPRIRHVDVI
jgi:hypothetical protein